ncbi:DnaJ protein homolog 2 [Durusdinium trenchii]|uniref:DnaJ protein homolog 2 n=1 Tax=Durusdinium trenchii TaxID=1381693 RepID=A0ABP0L9H0_9DINO
MASYYCVLNIAAHATAEEIKVAFKRCALQVHPDKGGSKEAFHAVYQAFETLADPEARKRYDDQLPTLKKVTKQTYSCKRTGAKSKKKRPEQKHSAAESDRSRHSGAESADASSHEKLLTKLYELLKRLPRKLRNDVIAREFSQKQRLLLEKWIVLQREAETDDVTPMPGGPGGPCGPCAQEVKPLKPVTVSDSHGSMLALTHQPFALGGSALSLPAVSHGKRRRKKYVAIKGIARCGSRKTISEDSRIYRANTVIATISIWSRYCDLATAIEFLVILTSIKQKMHGTLRDAETNFESCLQEALERSLIEHGRSYEDLSPRFAVHQSFGFFLGPCRHVSSPAVRSVREVAHLRRCMDPFRECARRRSWGRATMIWHFGLGDLEDLWDRFQKAVAEMWRSAGEGRSAKQLRRVRSLYVSHAGVRNKHVQYWERQHMGMNDRNKHRPSRLRDRCDRSADATRKLTDKVLQKVRKLLLRWQNALRKKDEMALQKQRQRFLQERRKQELAQRKRAREEQKAERLRREALRRKMMSDLTMDEILGHLDAFWGTPEQDASNHSGYGGGFPKNQTHYSLTTANY